MNTREAAALAEAAASRIAGLIRETPLDFSPRFSAETGAEVWFKLENLQYTGSFKLRGACNRLMTLTPAQRAAGCVTASSGNHGAAVAYAMQKLDISGVIFVPEQTAATKLEAIRAYGGDARLFGTDGLDTELHARAYAGQHGMFYVSPYNDVEVMAGQGSCGVEIARQLPAADVVLVAVGGGGLISGVGSVLRAHNPAIGIIACQPAASAVMAHSVAAGRVLEMPSNKTLSDGTAGGIEEGAITFELCRELSDEFVLVDEAEIAAAMRLYMDSEHQLIEGAAGVAVAGLLAKKADLRGKKVVVLICGANISRGSLRAVVC